MINEKERLSRLLYLELNRKAAAELFNTPELMSKDEALYVPVNPDFLVKKIQAEEQAPKDLPVAEFIYGMALVLALDPDFPQAGVYRLMLNNFEASHGLILSKAHSLFEADRPEEAYLVLKGLYEASGNEETESLLLSLGETLALQNESWQDEVLELAQNARENGNLNGYLIAGSIRNAQGKESEAVFLIREYLRLGGEETKEISTLLEILDRNNKAEAAYDALYEDPQGALQVLLELYPREGDNVRLIYAIAVAYRLLKNHEKAIYYLEEALSIDPAYMDVFHELGLNYALLDDFVTASRYFKTVYENTHEFEPMTNLIVALYRSGEMEEAKYLFTKAKMVKPEDEILKEIEKFYFS